MAILRKAIPLERRKVLKKSLAPTVGRLIIALGLFLVFFWLTDMVASGGGTSAAAMREKQPVLLFSVLLLLGGLALSPLIYEILYFLTYHYDIDDKNLVIRKGVIIKKEAILPFAKITDVYVDQDALDVAFAIYDVHISTPTVASGEFAHIDGVSRKNAAILRDMILERMNKESENQSGSERARRS